MQRSSRNEPSEVIVAAVLDAPSPTATLEAMAEALLPLQT
jgi:hypothetical protein